MRLGEVEGAFHSMRLCPRLREIKAKSSRRGKEQMRPKISESRREIKDKYMDLRIEEKPCNGVSETHPSRHAQVITSKHSTPENVSISARIGGSDDVGVTRNRVWCAGEFVGSRKAFFHDSGRGREAQKSISARRSFWVRWIHDFETRRRVFSSVVGSSRIWSTMWSSISGARGDDILVAARARQAEYQRSAVARFQRRFCRT